MKNDDKNKEDKNSKNNFLKKSAFYETNLKLNQYYENKSMIYNNNNLESNEQNDDRQNNIDSKYYFKDSNSKVNNSVMSSMKRDKITDEGFSIFNSQIYDCNYQNNSNQDIMEYKKAERMNEEIMEKKEKLKEKINNCINVIQGKNYYNKYEYYYKDKDKNKKLIEELGGLKENLELINDEKDFKKIKNSYEMLKKKINEYNI